MKLALTLIALAAFASNAQAANPKAPKVRELLYKSSVLQGIRHGVIKDYGMQHCGRFAVSSYAEKKGDFKAQAVCVYEDGYGDESGILIQVEGNFWDSETPVVSKVEFVFAG